MFKTCSLELKILENEIRDRNLKKELNYRPEIDQEVILSGCGSLSEWSYSTDSAIRLQKISYRKGKRPDQASTDGTRRTRPASEPSAVLILSLIHI